MNNFWGKMLCPIQFFAMMSNITGKWFFGLNWAFDQDLPVIKHYLLWYFYLLHMEKGNSVV